MNVKSSSHIRLCAAVAIVAIALSAGISDAAAKKIKKCGTIKSAGFYQLSRSITSNSSGVCLLISGQGVVLNLNGFDLTGNGSGTGIMITGSRVFIDGNDTNHNSSAITNFAVGIEDDGSNAVIENVGSTNNLDTGIYVNGANGSIIGSFSADHNTSHGVHLRNASRTLIHNFGPTNNGDYGVWAENSTRSVIVQFLSTNNGIAGAYFGCSATGPVGAGCAGSNSSLNVVASAQMDNNGGYGMAIDFASLGNVISNTGQHMNPISDVFDGNTLCGTNLWFQNVYGTSNEPTCTNE